MQSDKQISVLFVDYSAQAGGAQIALRQVMDAMASQQIAAYVPADSQWVNPDIARIAQPKSIRGPRRIDSFGRMLVSAGAQASRDFWSAFWLLRRLKPRLVYLNSPRALLTTGVVARLLRKPYAFHAHDALSREWIGDRFVFYLIHKMIRGAVLVVTNSAYSAQYLPPGAVVWANPVDKEFFEALKPSRVEPFFIVMVARLDPWKGQDLLLRAIKLAFPEGGPRIVLVGGPLFGREDYQRELGLTAENLGLDVEMPGHVADVIPYMDQATIVVSATYGAEPLGQSIMQAQARGRCVVAPATGGPAELIQDGVTGYLYDPGSESSLAKLLRRLYDEPSLVRSVEEPASRLARRFSTERAFPIIRKVIAGGLEGDEHGVA